MPECVLSGPSKAIEGRKIHQIEGECQYFDGDFFGRFVGRDSGFGHAAESEDGPCGICPRTGGGIDCREAGLPKGLLSVADHKGDLVVFPGASGQGPAPPGRYTDLPGQSVTKVADAGYYAPIVGMRGQISAPEGTYVPSAGSTSVVAVPPGYTSTNGVDITLLPQIQITALEPLPGGMGGESIGTADRGVAPLPAKACTTNPAGPYCPLPG